ncbi:MAG TPA: glycosyl hydrolase family 28-related protein, partial [Pyrinomonadaceae bacterium]|nr:glycosyl hydrolase family 28-related protein [Pyrinomonadaceae bacterium]
MNSKRHLALVVAGCVAVALLFSAAPRASFSFTTNTAPAGVYDVKTYGAKGDGKALDTAAINKTIDAAAAAGGGTVYFPAGNYLSVSIHLKSSIALYLDQGATIVAANTSKEAQYDPPEPNQWEAYQDFGHTHWHNSLIWGENLTNVSILGPGTIWGKGLVRGGNQSRTQAQNDALNAARANEPKQPFGYPNPRDAVESGWG